LQLSKPVYRIDCVGEEVTASFKPARLKEEPAPTQVLVYHPVSLGAIPSKSSLFLMSLAANRQATDGHAFGQSPTV